MKRLIFSIILVFCLCVSVQAKNWIFAAYDGTTGGTSGKLDAIDACNADGSGYDLQNNEAAIVWDQANGQFVFYIFNSTSGATENDPLIVKPDYCNSPTGYTGDGRWIMASVRADTFQGGLEIVDDADGVTVTAEQARQGVAVYESGNQQTVGLPLVEDGMVVCVFCTGADGSAEVYVDPNIADHIDHDGVSAAAGEYLRNSSDAKDDYACFMGKGTNTWKLWGYRGTWVEETPP